MIILREDYYGLLSKIMNFITRFYTSLFTCDEIPENKIIAKSRFLHQRTVIADNAFCCYQTSTGAGRPIAVY